MSDCLPRPTSQVRCPGVWRLTKKGRGGCIVRPSSQFNGALRFLEAIGNALYDLRLRTRYPHNSVLEEVLLFPVQSFSTLGGWSVIPWPCWFFRHSYGHGLLLIGTWRSNRYNGTKIQETTTKAIRCNLTLTINPSKESIIALSTARL